MGRRSWDHAPHLKVSDCVVGLSSCKCSLVTISTFGSTELVTLSRHFGVLCFNHLHYQLVVTTYRFPQAIPYRSFGVVVIKPWLASEGTFCLHDCQLLSLLFLHLPKWELGLAHPSQGTRFALKFRSQKVYPVLMIIGTSDNWIFFKNGRVDISYIIASSSSWVCSLVCFTILIVVLVLVELFWWNYNQGDQRGLSYDIMGHLIPSGVSTCSLRKCG